MPGIRFESVEDTLEILNPLRQFQREQQRVELRRDPLLGSVSVYNPALKGKAQVFFGAIDWDLVERLAQQSASSCVFCPEHLDRTAQYPPELVPDGRLRVGEAVLFPNLHALAQYHAVVALSRAHFLRLDELRPRLFADALIAAQRFVDIVYRRDAAAAFVSVNANYLFPAGASLMHPHVQLLMGRQPYSAHARLVSACQAYYAQHGSAYHADLVVEERRIGARYIAQRGPWHWLSAFSPTGSNEILAIHPQAGDFAALDDAELEALAEGLHAVLRLYQKLGYLSFNWTLFSLRAGGDAGFRCLLRIVNRQNPYPNYRSDDFFLQKLLHSEVILQLPEELAREAREEFSGTRD
jgi:UDPglucose--hexose-1-phosphate uridylyltransferase